MSSYISVDLDIDDYIDQIDTDDLLKELENRHIYVEDTRRLLERIYLNRKTNLPYDDLLEQYIWKTIGRQ